MPWLSTINTRLSFRVCKENVDHDFLASLDVKDTSVGIVWIGIFAVGHYQVKVTFQMEGAVRNFQASVQQRSARLRSNTSACQCVRC